MAASEFEAYMESLVEALRRPVPDGELAGILQAPYTHAVFKAPAREDMRDVNRALRDAVSALEHIEDPYNACRLAYVVGVFIEEGADADDLTRELASCMARCLRELRPLQEAVDPDHEGIPTPLDHLALFPGGTRALLGIPDLSRALMTALCRAKNARMEVRGWEAFRRDVRELSFANDGYLEGLLDCVDDVEITVLHVAQQRGFEVRTEGVRNNFHLFSLLQAALIGEVRDGLLDGPIPDPRMTAYMRGETHERPGDTDYAVWHFGNFHSWTSDGYDNDLQRTTIWGEQSPLDIPMFEGRRLILLGPSALGSKSWDANFIGSLHDAHEPRLWTTALTAREVTELLDRLAQCDSR